MDPNAKGLLVQLKRTIGADVSMGGCFACGFIDSSATSTCKFSDTGEGDRNQPTRPAMLRSVGLLLTRVAPQTKFDNVFSKIGKQKKIPSRTQCQSGAKSIRAKAANSESGTIFKGRLMFMEADVS